VRRVAGLLAAIALAMAGQACDADPAPDSASAPRSSSADAASPSEVPSVGGLIAGPDPDSTLTRMNRYDVYPSGAVMAHWRATGGWSAWVWVGPQGQVRWWSDTNPERKILVTGEGFVLPAAPALGISRSLVVDATGDLHEAGSGVRGRRWTDADAWDPRSDAEEREWRFETVSSMDLDPPASWTLTSVDLTSLGGGVAVGTLSDSTDDGWFVGYLVIGRFSRYFTIDPETLTAEPVQPPDGFETLRAAGDILVTQDMSNGFYQVSRLAVSADHGSTWRIVDLLADGKPG